MAHERSPHVIVVVDLSTAMVERVVGPFATRFFAERAVASLNRQLSVDRSGDRRGFVLPEGHPMARVGAGALEKRA